MRDRRGHYYAGDPGQRLERIGSSEAREIIDDYIGELDDLDIADLRSGETIESDARRLFSIQGVLLFGSMLAYLCAQLTDNFLYHFWKRVTKGRHLWLRNNASTWVSQLVDTAVVNSILFYLGFGWDFWQGVQVMAVIYFYKVCLAALDTPLIYLGVFLVKRVLRAELASEEAA